MPSPTPAPEQTRRVRKPSVPLDAAKVSTGKTSSDEASAFLTRLDPVVSGVMDGKAKKSAARNTPATIDLGSLGVDEEDIAKLVPERIFSMEVHPSPRLLCAAGDTWGRVGLWDVEAGDDNPVATFEPHSRPVAGLRVPPYAPHQLLSCSHDGAVRCMDLSSGAASSFVELYRAPEDGDGDYPKLHAISRTAGEGGAHVVCRDDGKVVLLDTRLPAASISSVALHEKKIFSADFSPANHSLLATASLDRTVALWDIRSMGGPKKPKALAVLEHGLSVTAARFSPTGQRLLTTCNDDFLRVFEAANGAKWTQLSSTRHNNHTGRYITPFQAEWLRGSDDTFVCGSLSQPRGIDVLHCSPGAQGSPRLLHDNVNSVLSLLVWHPTLNVLAASNASGKVFLWR